MAPGRLVPARASAISCSSVKPASCSAGRGVGVLLLLRGLEVERGLERVDALRRQPDGVGLLTWRHTTKPLGVFAGRECASGSAPIFLPSCRCGNRGAPETRRQRLTTCRQRPISARRFCCAQERRAASPPRKPANWSERKLALSEGFSTPSWHRTTAVVSSMHRFCR